jgi:hypothetical protein
MSGAVELASGVVNALTAAFKDAGFTPPAVTFTETETTLTLIAQGARPTGTHSLNQDFISELLARETSV